MKDDEVRVLCTALLVPCLAADIFVLPEAPLSSDQHSPSVLPSLAGPFGPWQTRHGSGTVGVGVGRLIQILIGATSTTPAHP